METRNLVALLAALTVMVIANASFAADPADTVFTNGRIGVFP